MTSDTLGLPRLLTPARRIVFLGLATVAAAEVGAQVVATGALKALLIGAIGGSPAVFLLLATGFAAATLGCLRGVIGERIGLAYVNDVRGKLALHALAAASSDGPGRFGTLAIRMTGDLAALKDWANVGVCGGAAALVGLFGACAAGYWTSGLAGLAAALTGPMLVLVICGVLVTGLSDAVEKRRAERGRLSARIGDMLLGADAFTAYGAERAAIRPVQGAGRALMRAQTRQVAFAQVMNAPAALTLPVGTAVALAVTLAGFGPTGGVAGWAALLFTLSLSTMSTSALVNAILQFIERRVALDKLSELVASAGAARPAAPRGGVRLRPGPGSTLSINGLQLVAAGAESVLSRLLAEPLLDEILRGSGGVMVDGVAAPDIAAADWARRIAYAGPRRGLSRNRVTAMLAAKHPATPQSLSAALDVAGLPQSWLAEDRMIDPQSTLYPEYILARLRLARALAHRPRVLIIDDPWLMDDGELLARVRAWRLAQQVSLIFISDATETEQLAKGMRLVKG